MMSRPGRARTLGLWPLSMPGCAATLAWWTASLRRRSPSPGLGQAIGLGRYGLIPPPLALVIALAFRRAYPVGAFVTGVLVGAVQVGVGIWLNVIDVAIVILLYTLAAYRPRLLSVPRSGRLPMSRTGAMVCGKAVRRSRPDIRGSGLSIFGQRIYVCGRASRRQVS